MTIVAVKRGRGAPKQPEEMKRTARVIFQLSDGEKEDLHNFAEKRRVKAVEVLRSALRNYLATGAPPPEHLHVPERQETGFPPRGNRILIPITNAERHELTCFLTLHQVKASPLVRYALKIHINSHYCPVNY